ncbi:hypothetical protein SCLCIDRAFT_1222686 [Scleroderma citrinum Foug A]|uniref:Uncharacterized protein n=1 Tax=Scleroderma citrinum Foug A TaxID=1036808 RepID=A0A0C3DAZ0_9AGAM|nr:hypothetical protein SCLCIDRAFT_1222686 [Scleroderma citrinum Foug A]
MGNSQTQGITSDDIIIFLVGPSDGEKRYFIERLDLDYRAAKSSFASVSAVYGIQSWVYSLGWMVDNTVLVVVPSFDEAGAHYSVKNWCEAKGFTTLGRRSGVLYIHPTSKNPDVEDHLEKFLDPIPRWSQPVRTKVVPSVPLNTSSSVDDTRVGILQAAVNRLNSRRWNVTVSPRFVKGPDIAYDIVQGLAKELSNGA